MQEHYQHWVPPGKVADLERALQKKDDKIATLRQIHKAELERQQQQHDRYVETLWDFREGTW